MTETKKNLLFIAPDSLPPGISRGFWLARELSEHFNVFYIQWQDSRATGWQNRDCKTMSKAGNIMVSAEHFIKSCLTRTRLVKKTCYGAQNLIYTYVPIMQKSAISHFTGEIAARKIARKFNEFFLKRLLNKINFSYIFHGDALMLAPSISDKIPSFFDVQDDFNENAETSELMDYERGYLQKNLAKCKILFAINESTAEHFSQLSGFKFDVLPNGADFSRFNDKNRQLAKQIKVDLGLSSKRTVVFIGSASHFDQIFTAKLAEMAIKRDPNIHFLLIGNLPRVEKSNVTNLGIISPEQIHLYYMLADLGFMPQSTADPFIKNCHPLKIIQFSAAQKAIIAPMLDSYQSGLFPNVFVTDYEPSKWMNRIEELSDFKWDEKLTAMWSAFSWTSLVKKLASQIHAS